METEPMSLVTRRPWRWRLATATYPTESVVARFAWVLIHVWRDNMNRRSILSVSATIALGLALLGITAGSTARAAEMRLLCAVALQPAMIALIQDFEKSSGHKVTIAYGTAGAVADRVHKGEAADIVISSEPMIDRLQAQGKLMASSRVNTITKVGVGVIVRKAGTKPDLATVDG